MTYESNILTLSSQEIPHAFVIIEMAHLPEAARKSLNYVGFNEWYLLKLCIEKICCCCEWMTVKVIV